MVLGLTNLDHPGAHSQTRSVRSIVVHPRYNRAVVDYDISVVQLDSEVRTSRTTPTQMETAGSDQFWLLTGGGDGPRQAGVSAPAGSAADPGLLLLHHRLGSHGQPE